MRSRKILIPAMTALLSAGGFAFAQTQTPAQTAAQPAPAAQQERVAKPAPKQEVGVQKSAAEKTAEAATPAQAVAPRSAEQAAVSQELARKAPDRKWRMAALNPAQQSTVMFPQNAKKVSDVSIIASVDQVNRLETFDITGESSSDKLSMPTSGPKFTSDLTRDSAPPLDETGVESEAKTTASVSPTSGTSPYAVHQAEPAPRTDAGAAVAPDAGAPVGVSPTPATAEPAPKTEPQD